MKTMSVDYQSLMVIILINTFGLLLVALVKHTTLFIIVLVLFIQGLILLLLLVITITVNQVQWATLIPVNITLMTFYGMEQDVQEIVVVVITPPNLGSIISWTMPHKMTLKHEYVHMVILILDQLWLISWSCTFSNIDYQPYWVVRIRYSFCYPPHKYSFLLQFHCVHYIQLRKLSLSTYKLCITVLV